MQEQDWFLWFLRSPWNWTSYIHCRYLQKQKLYQIGILAPHASNVSSEHLDLGMKKHSRAPNSLKKMGNLMFTLMVGKNNQSLFVCFQCLERLEVYQSSQPSRWGATWLALPPPRSLRRKRFSEAGAVDSVVSFGKPPFMGCIFLFSTDPREWAPPNSSTEGVVSKYVRFFVFQKFLLHQILWSVLLGICSRF